MNVLAYTVLVSSGLWPFRMRLMWTFEIVKKLDSHTSFLVRNRWFSLDNAVAACEGAALYLGRACGVNKFSRNQKKPLNYTVKAQYIFEIFNILESPH